MHLFDTTDPGVIASQRKFWITIVVLSIATYGTAFFAIWLVRKREEDLPQKTSQDGKEQGPEEKGEEVTTNWKERNGTLGEFLMSKGKTPRGFRWRGDKKQVSEENAA